MGQQPIIFTVKIIADIYLGHITHWNDTAIVQLNPQLESKLPYKPILVVFEPGTSLIAGSVSKLLATVVEFNQTVRSASPCLTQELFTDAFIIQVGQGTNIVYPVSLTDRGVSSAPHGSVISTLKAVKYSVGFWAFYEVVQARNLQVGSLINPAGNVVHPSKATVVSAASDFSHEDVIETDLVLGTSHRSIDHNWLLLFI